MNALKDYGGLRIREERLFELSSVPQMLVDRNRVIVRVNRKFCDLFGYAPEEILGRKTVVLTPSEKKFKEYRKHFVQTRDGIIESTELLYRKRGGKLFWVKLEGTKIENDEGDFFILWSFIDIDKEVHDRTMLKEMASKDSMTGLYNRGFFAEMANEMIALAKREKYEIGIVMLDIDRFKTINDTYGHHVGDSIIVALAIILKEGMRESDLAARYGGEEFVLLLPMTSIESSTAIAERLREKIEAERIPLQNGETIQFTVSCGVSTVGVAFEESADMGIIRADRALYRAKKGGRNRIEVEPLKPFPI